RPRATRGRCCAAVARSISSSGSPSRPGTEPEVRGKFGSEERSHRKMARILTVDDSRSVRMIVVREVQALGYEVHEAEDGEKGLVKLAEGQYDLVILDVT